MIITVQTLHIIYSEKMLIQRLSEIRDSGTGTYHFSPSMQIISSILKAMLDGYNGKTIQFV